MVFYSLLNTKRHVYHRKGGTSITQKRRCSRIVKGTKRHLLSHKKARISQMIKSQLSKIKQHILKNILSEKQKMPKKE
jgi:hypothetical protein